MKNSEYSLSVRTFAGFLVVLQFSSLTVIALLAALDFTTSYWYINISFIAIAGYLVTSAYKSLKPSLSVNPIPKNGAEFIQVGIYRTIRHPMYAAVILFSFGASGFSSNNLAIIFCGVLIVGIIAKSILEDNLLLKRHPEIREYQLNTPGFFPCRCKS